MSTEAKGSPPAAVGAQVPPLRRFCIDAERVVETTQSAEITVIANSEDEAWEKARALLDDGDVEWDEDDFDEGEAELSLASSEKLTDEEFEEYLEEQQAEEEAIKASKQEATRRTDLHSILASLRTTTSEEERGGLIDDIERLIL